MIGEAKRLGAHTIRLLALVLNTPIHLAAYRDGFRLLLKFVHQQTGKTPSKLQLEDLDADRTCGLTYDNTHSRGGPPWLYDLQGMRIYISWQEPGARSGDPSRPCGV